MFIGIPLLYFERLFQIIIASAQNMLAERRVELREVTAPPPNSDYEIFVTLRVLHRIKENFTVYGVELELMTSKTYKGFDKLCQLFYTYIVAKDGVMYLNRQRPSVYNIRKLKFCE